MNLMCYAVISNDIMLSFRTILCCHFERYYAVISKTILCCHFERSEKSLRRDFSTPLRFARNDNLTIKNIIQSQRLLCHGFRPKGKTNDGMRREDKPPSASRRIAAI